MRRHADPLDDSGAQLRAGTWDLFAEVVERNNGIYGGCWCIAFHAQDDRLGDHRETKERLVRAGRAHATLVLDEHGAAQGWTQYGSPEELDGINHRREHDKAPPSRPGWRITCVFVDKRHRGQGEVAAAVAGALRLIREAGRGTVEAISEVTDGRRAQSRFLRTGIAEMLEDLGFEKAGTSASAPGP